MSLGGESYKPPNPLSLYNREWYKPQNTPDLYKQNSIICAKMSAQNCSYNRLDVYEHLK